MSQNTEGKLELLLDAYITGPKILQRVESAIYWSNRYPVNKMLTKQTVLSTE